MAALLSAAVSGGGEPGVETAVCWDGADAMATLPEFYRNLCIMFQEVPSGTLVELWKFINDFGVARLNEAGDADETVSREWSAGMVWVLKTYSCLLNNASVFDHRTAGVVIDQVKHCISNEMCKLTM